MEETLTDCLVRVREDLNQLKTVRDYLDTNAETEERCSISWKTIEAFNSILSVCSSQNSPETNALDTLLDSFYYLARNNSNDSVWDDFGFELGIICVKVLSAIERSDVFEILFCKLLSVISIISEHNSNVWKSTGRQILNVLINKKVSLPYLEAILKLYICILKNIESTTLHDFSTQNLHLLKTLSLSVQKLGDFEIQSNVIELIFLHLSKNGKLISDFFSSETLRFNDFENDCRLYLNELNKPRRGIERKVYSICCHVLYLGGCFVEPPTGKNFIWVDANKDSERVTIKYGDVESTGDRIISIDFKEILNVQLENDKTEGNRCLTIRTKSLLRVQKDVRNDDVCLVVENTEEVYQFVHFLKSVISEKKKKKKFEGKSSKTIDFLLIDRNKKKMEVQDNSITSSERNGIDHILPDVLSLFERANQRVSNSTSRVTTVDIKTPPKAPGVVLESQELSPNSFVESLNKHIGLGSPELRHTFEDSVETVEFLQKTTPSGHKLFRSPEKIFDIPETTTNPNINFIFGENKENHPAEEVFKPEIKTYARKQSKSTKENVQVLKERKPLEVKLSNSQSQDYFRVHLQKKKPSLPKLKRSTKSIKNPKQVVGKESYKVTNKTSQHLGKPKAEQKESEKQKKPIPIKQQGNEKQQQDKLKQGHVLRQTEDHKPKPKQKDTSTEKSKHVQQKQQTKQRQQSLIESKPSLLDPNGYAYRRWCQPTTSERSNFWLKKLTETEKPKNTSDSIFDFSEDIFGEKKKKRRVVRSKPKPKPKPSLILQQANEIIKKSPPKPKPNQMTLQQAREILKKSSPKPKLSSKVQREVPETPPQIETSFKFPQTNLRVSPEHLKPTEDSEYESLSENEEPPLPTKKRDRSDEDSSSSRKYTKKKPKITLPSHIISILRLRLRKAEERDKQTTDDIIQTIRKATDHLINHLYRKNGEKIISYLTTAETACTVFSGEIDELELRAKRMQRAVLYFKAGCTISDTHEVLDDQFSRLRTSLMEFKEMKDNSKTTDRVNERLSNLIKSGIQELIKNEWETKKSRLLSCASTLGVDLGGFQGFLQT